MKSLPSIEIDRITSDSEVPQIIAVITIRGKIIAIQGDISFITGLPKAGKTWMAVYILATALGADSTLDTLQIRSTPADGKPVVYIDTEQPKAYTKSLINRINKLLAIDKEPENLFIYNLKRYSRPEKLRRVRELMKLHSDAHLWIVDGIADLINDPNDVKESFGIIDELMIMAEDNKTAIVLCLHENPGNGKMRGNLGSEAERKCGATITIKKDRTTGIHSISSRIIRGSGDFEDVHFRYNEELGRMVSLEAGEWKIQREDNQARKVQNQKIKLHKLASTCFLGGIDHLDEKELINRIIKYDTPGKEVSKKTAQRRFDELIERGMIEDDQEGRYCLVRQ